LNPHKEFTAMKSVARVSTVALLLFVSGVWLSASAQTASGKFRFPAEDGLTKSVEFSVATLNGSTSGQMTFTDEKGVSESDVDGAAGGRTGDPMSYYIKAEFDCLLVDKNRAVMCGTVKDSNIKSYVGQRVMLMVEDNGDDLKTRDRVFWGVYKPVGGWVPVDAERPDDKGATLTWTATDAERKDDPGIPSRPSTIVGCKSFSLAAYTMQEGEGSIQIKP
jgi:hypothetical protein